MGDESIEMMLMMMDSTWVKQGAPGEQAKTRQRAPVQRTRPPHRSIVALAVAAAAESEWLASSSLWQGARPVAGGAKEGACGGGRAHRLHGGPALGGRLVSVRVVAWLVQDGDADAPVLVHCTEFHEDEGHAHVSVRWVAS